MLGGFGLGVPTALTVVVAPTPASAVTAVGYGAAVAFVTTIFLPASEGESAAAYEPPASASSEVAAS